MSSVIAEPSREGRSAPKSSCAHCGLPAPPPAEDASPSFCCNGCRGAYHLIRGWGLDQFYDLRDGVEGPVQEDVGQGRFEDLDHPELLGRSAPRAVRSEGDQTLLQSTLSIAGIHCAACLWLLEKAPAQVLGWKSARLNLHRRTIDVVYDPSVIQLSAIAVTIAQLGYIVSPIAEDASEQVDDENRQLLIEIAIAGFCAANAMWLAVALYAGQFSGIAASHALALRIAGVLLGCIAVVFPGRVFFRGAIASIRTRTPHMDLPVALGLGAGLLGSLYGLFDLSREVYFDSIATLVFFLLVGRWLQARQTRCAGDEVADLIRLAPLNAKRISKDGSIKRVPLADLVIGDSVHVDPGDNIPIDGDISEGQSTVDRSLLTGESQPISVAPGDSVEAGTTNVASQLVVIARAVGDDTRFAKLQQSVSDAALSRTPMIQMANRIGGWFVMTVIVLAIGTFIAWMIRDPDRAVTQSVALLIVACPCALALATPLAIALSIGRLAQKRILVRSGESLERIATPGTAFFDKTGTLTEGKMKIVDWQGDPGWIKLAGEIESKVNHPIATAIADYSQANAAHESRSYHIESVEQLPGKGIHAVVAGLGSIQIGSPDLLDGALHGDAVETTEQWARDGKTAVVVLVGNEVQGLIAITDSIRDESQATVAWFRDQGWKVGILSGDRQSTVDKVANQLDFRPGEAKGQLLPNEKLVAIEQASKRGPVIMVGDGLNDAAALAAADVGIAIRGGVSTSLAAAPVIIADGQLSRTIEFVQASRLCRRAIVKNMVVSIAYNAFAVVLAITGIITPLIAAVLMPISSLSVILMTLSNPDAETIS